MSRPLALDDDALQSLAAAAQALLDDHLDAFKTAWQTVPIPLRVLASVAYLAGADAPLSLNQVAKVGGYSRTGAKPKYADVIDIVRTALPVVLDHLAETSRTGETVADLDAKLHNADRRIEQLESRLAQAQTERDQALGYARDLHRQLKPEYEENLRTRAERVIDVTPRLRPVPTQDHDGPEETS